MLDDPRINRVLKRYPKGEQFSDGEIDVTEVGLPALLWACHRTKPEELDTPIEIDSDGIAYLAGGTDLEFEPDRFDYYLHSYVRSEYRSTYYKDPTVSYKPSPEDGPPANISLPEGTAWRPSRPKDGKENWVIWGYDEDDGADSGPS